MGQFERAAVIVGGCGRVGLPLGVALASRGRTVTLYDINAEAVDVLRANGLDPSSGSLDLRSNPQVRQQVLDTLKRHGYGPAAGAGAAAGAAAAPAAADSAAERPGVDRLMELQQMKDKGLISDADFEETKDRILKEM